MTDRNSQHALLPALAPEDLRAVSPALERYSREALVDGLWKRPALSLRDRSIVTVAALIARMQTTEMPFHFSLALDNGVQPGELSEMVTHLAFYAGWGNAMSAVPAARELFRARGIQPDALPPANGALLPVNEEAEAQRASQVETNFGSVSPALLQQTTEVLFQDLWLRPALAPRDRSLVTVAALVAAGQVAQIPYHLVRAMNNGLTRNEAAELPAHLAYYAGWPNAFSALAVFKEVFAKAEQ